MKHRYNETKILNILVKIKGLLELSDSNFCFLFLNFVISYVHASTFEAMVHSRNTGPFENPRIIQTIRLCFTLLVLYTLTQTAESLQFASGCTGSRILPWCFCSYTVKLCICLPQVKAQNGYQWVPSQQNNTRNACFMSLPLRITLCTSLTLRVMGPHMQNLFSCDPFPSFMS